MVRIILAIVDIVLSGYREIDKVLPWSMDLPSSCRVSKKNEANKK